MSKFLKYIGKYDKLNYKNHIFLKDMVTEVNDKLAKFIMSKGYLGTQFKIVADPGQFEPVAKQETTVEEIVAKLETPVAEVVVPEPVIEEVAVVEPVIEEVTVPDTVEVIKNKKSKKKGGAFINEDSYTDMQDAREYPTSD